MNRDTYRVSAPHFVAGVVVYNGLIINAAPILKWCIGNRLSYFRGYCDKKKWQIEKVGD